MAAHNAPSTIELCSMIPLPILGRNCYAGVMTRTALLLAAAAAALAATPLAARPMTATDMHMMHRLGVPEVSGDGKWAVFTISATDLDKNKRINTLYLLDLTKAGATPQPIAGAEKGHDAVFAPDGSIWFLMAANDQDQLFRLTLAARRRRSAISRVTSAGSSSRRRATASSFGPTATSAAAISIAPICRPSPQPAAPASTTNCLFATGIRGRVRESARGCSASRSTAASSQVPVSH